MSKLNDSSRQLSYLLRHNPENLVMDKEGWVKVDAILNKLDISFDILKDIVTTSDKQRFIFGDGGRTIRANQGHSKKLNLKIKYKEIRFPQIYYHGTTFENKNSILRRGLQPGSRDYVHLSHDIPTAVNVGTRHVKNGSTVMILEIDGARMKLDGIKVFESENGVILVKEVPPSYISEH